MRTVPTIFMAILIAIAQTSSFLFLRPLQITPDFLAIFAAYVLLHEEGARSVLLIWAIGLIRDGFSAQRPGLYAVTYALTAFFVGDSRLTAYSKHFVPRMLVSALFVVVSMGAESCLRGLSFLDAGAADRTWIIGQATLWTMIATPLAFPACSWIGKWIGIMNPVARASRGGGTS